MVFPCTYAISDNPLGPYKKCGVIVDNIYCDPASWNNHGSIAEFKGQWYVFYHRSSQNRKTCRRVCVEPIYFDENGRIQEVEMTSSGVEHALKIRDGIPARAACRMMGACHITLQGDREILVSKKGGHWRTRDWAEYKYLDFGNGENRTFALTVKGRGRIEVKLEDDTTLCKLFFNHAEAAEVTAPIPAVSGRHALWLLLEGDFEVHGFRIQ